MKTQLFASLFAIFFIVPAGQAQNNQGNNSLFIDVHYLSDGKVKYADVADAHVKDLEVQSKYGVQFMKYWVDEPKGIVYCLSSAPDSSAVSQTHRDAHGLLPVKIYKVQDGEEAAADGQQTFFLDIHELGPGSVTAADVENAHQKDLAVQNKHGVKFINYWVDESTGSVFCLSQAKEASRVVAAHKEAHGLIPVSVNAVKQGF